MRNAVIAFFIAIFVIVALGWGTCAYVGYQIVSDPEGTGDAVGGFAEKLHRGYKDAINPK